MIASRLFNQIALIFMLLILLLGIDAYAEGGITLDPLSTYNTGLIFEGAAEIVVHDPQTQRLFVVNAGNKRLDILDLSNPTALEKVGEIDVSDYGSPNSVAVYNSLVVIAVENADQQALGYVVFANSDGEILNSVEVGALPDMVIYTPDGKKVLTANEGQPNDAYTIDPEGTVSIIDVSDDPLTVNQTHVTTLDFTAFNDRTDIRAGNPDGSLAQNIEPEYIAVSSDSTMAWVTLQENNAIAIIDLEAGEVLDLVSLGYKDHSLPGNGLDASNRDDGINITTWPIKGMYQPDTIAAYQVDGKTYLIIANEGDSRDYGGYSEETRVKDLILDSLAFPNAAELQAEENLGRLKTTTATGDENGDGQFEEIYAYGGRSFSILDAEGNLVFDSGDEIAQIIAQTIPQGFNANDEDDSFDDRSDDKGAEPEGATVGVINGRTYAFIGLERVGGVIIYDVTNPNNPSFVSYNTNRNFEGVLNQGTAGDISPEGLAFISTENSPTNEPLLIVAHEVSGTTTVFAIKGAKTDSTAKTESTTETTATTPSSPVENTTETPTETPTTMPQAGGTTLLSWLNLLLIMGGILLIGIGYYLNKGCLLRFTN